MISDSNTTAKSNSPTIEAEELEKILEIELIQKRAEWKKQVARNRSLRATSFAFLFILIMAAALALMYLMSRMGDRRPHIVSPTPTTAPRH